MGISVGGRTMVASFEVPDPNIEAEVTVLTRSLLRIAGSSYSMHYNSNPRAFANPYCNLQCNGDTCSCCIALNELGEDLDPQDQLTINLVGGQPAGVTTNTGNGLCYTTTTVADRSVTFYLTDNTGGRSENQVALFSRSEISGSPTLRVRPRSRSVLPACPLLRPR